MLMLEANFDESHDGQKNRAYGMAGILATADDWNCLWGDWGRTLAKHEIARFHAAESEGYPERQRDFIGILTRSDSHRFIGHATFVLMEPYNVLLPRLRKARQIPDGEEISGTLASPYFLAFEDCIRKIALAGGIESLPVEEQVAFVFDQTSEFGGKALKLFNLIRDGSKMPYRKRLGSCAFGDKERLIPLQAADLMAYEYMRNIRDCVLDGGAERWQYTELKNRFGAGWLFNEAHLTELVESFEQQP